MSKGQSDSSSAVPGTAGDLLSQDSPLLLVTPSQEQSLQVSPQEHSHPPGSPLGTIVCRGKSKGKRTRAKWEWLSWETSLLRVPESSGLQLREVVETSPPASPPAPRANATETQPDSHGVTSAQGFSSLGICSSVVLKQSAQHHQSCARGCQDVANSSSSREGDTGTACTGKGEMGAPS